VTQVYVDRPLILVIDDDRDVCGLLEDLLAEEYRVEIRATGAAGLARLDAGGVDLVLLDLRLPDCDGRELCHRVRHWEAELPAHLPIVVVSADDALTTCAACLDAGADDYLAKPFDLADLLDRVESALQHRAGSGSAGRLTYRGRLAAPSTVLGSEPSQRLGSARAPSYFDGRDVADFSLELANW
jgi:DNA-binding response OmpR family regulator